jgi:hypothetical protein
LGWGEKSGRNVRCCAPEEKQQRQVMPHDTVHPRGKGNTVRLETATCKRDIEDGGGQT